MLDVVITGRQRELGGFVVGRLLPNSGRRMVGPFIFFDHLGPLDLPPGISRSMDVRPHPHIGISTVTYLFAGEIVHRDSLASEQPIRAGEVNWMTAGRGVTHSERFEWARREGGPLNAIQAWVALPEADEEGDPAFAHHGPRELPVLEEKKVWGRLLGGEAFGLRSPVRTHSPLFYLHWELMSGACAELPKNYPERAIYVVAGVVEIEGQAFERGQMAVFAPNMPASLRAKTGATVVALGGDPVGPRFIEWNFVSSSQRRIEQAKADWRAGRMKLPDFDANEFLGLSSEPCPPASPMS